jgi:hypothetical protein
MSWRVRVRPVHLTSTFGKSTAKTILLKKGSSEAGWTKKLYFWKKYGKNYILLEKVRQKLYTFGKSTAKTILLEKVRQKLYFWKKYNLYYKYLTIFRYIFCNINKYIHHDIYINGCKCIIYHSFQINCLSAFFI